MKIVILGNKYKLTAYDLKNLKNHTIYHLPFPKEDEISKYEAIFKQLFQKKKIDIVVFNFDYPLPSALNTLFAKAKGEGITFLTIYHFVEKYCFKLLYLSKKDEENLLDEVKKYTKLQYCIKRVIDYMISIPLFVGTLPRMLYSIYRIKKSRQVLFFLFKIELASTIDLLSVLNFAQCMKSLSFLTTIHKMMTQEFFLGGKL